MIPGGAAPPVGDHTKIIILAGPVKYWWDENWEMPEHWEYAKWRDEVSAALVEAKYLVYRPHEAFKGTWNEKAQAVNDAAIAVSDLMLNLSPPGVPSVGTDAECRYALTVGTPVMTAPPSLGIKRLMAMLSVVCPIPSF